MGEAGQWGEWTQLAWYLLALLLGGAGSALTTGGIISDLEWSRQEPMPAWRKCRLAAGCAFFWNILMFAWLIDFKGMPILEERMWLMLPAMVLAQGLFALAWKGLKKRWERV